MLVHHYTNINTLALILKNKKIRFTRLDKVDDLTEAKNMRLGKCVFVSCWTDSAEESIPLWQLYTEKMRGIRITLEDNWPWYRETKSGFSSPVPKDQQFTSHYTILPALNSSEHFFNKVIYVDNPYDYYLNQVKPYSETQINIDITNIAVYKNKDWKFQEEVRYILIVFPNTNMKGISKDEYVKFINDSMTKCEGQSVEYFDIDINPEFVNNMQVTLGPCCNEGDERIVQSLLKEYTTNGIYKRSALTGNIKCK